MKQLFDELSLECSRLTTKKYSTSFSVGILFLHKRMRSPVYSIYGFVRLADEIVDSFHSYNKKSLWYDFRKQTYDAIENKISLNPMLNSFQEVVHRYAIPPELIESFFDSMEMDLQKLNYNTEEYHKYIFGSAEAVGLMCLCVFMEGNKKLYGELERFARKLGAAFQKVNFLRDLAADQQYLERSYFPGIDPHNFDIRTKKEVENEIAADFAGAYEGIRALPIKARMGVYVAYRYYLSLFNRIRKKQPAFIMKNRIRVPDYWKLVIILDAGVRNRMNLI